MSDDERVGTPEQITAADSAWRAARDSGMPRDEWRALRMKYVRLRQFKVRKRRPPSKLRADQEYRLRLIAEDGKKKVAQAEKAIESLYDLASSGRSAILMRQFVSLAEAHGPTIMEEQLKNGD